MAITNGYSTLARWKAQYIPGAPTNAADDTVIEILIESASRFIEQEVWPRTFWARTETHSFDLPVEGNGRTLFFNDYLITATTLTNGDATVISASSYVLYPVSERGTTAVEVPNYKLELRPSASLTFVAANSGDPQRCITLLGSWGYASSTPFDIEQACMELTWNAYNRRKGTQVDTITRITAGGVLITPQDINSSVLRVLNRYPRGLGIDY